MAYQELQKTQFNNANTSLQSLLFRGLANRESDKARNIFKEQATCYAATNNVHLFEHTLNLYEWASLASTEGCGMVNPFLVRLTRRRLIWGTSKNALRNTRSAWSSRWNISSRWTTTWLTCVNVLSRSANVSLVTWMSLTCVAVAQEQVKGQQKWQFICNPT